MFSSAFLSCFFLEYPPDILGITRVFWNIRLLLLKSGFNSISLLREGSVSWNIHQLLVAVTQTNQGSTLLGLEALQRQDLATVATGRQWLVRGSSPVGKSTSGSSQLSWFDWLSQLASAFLELVEFG